MRINTRLAAIALAAGLAVAGCAPGGGDDGGGDGDGGGGGGDLLIGTAGEGGTYFYVGQGMAAVIEANTDLAATSQGTAGGTENTRRLSTGDMDMGLLSSDDLERTFDDDTADPNNLRVLMSGHPTVMHVAVRADSPYQALADLIQPGTRLGVGEPGSNVQNQAADVLGLYDLTLDDVEGAELSQSEQATALQDGEIEGAFLGGGLPLASASEIDANVGARILSIPPDKLAQYLEENPADFETTIPAGTYSGTTSDVATPAYPSLLVVNADMSDDVAYEITKTLLEHADEVAKVHPAGAEYTLENAFRGAEYYTGDLGVKFHPGAQKYYEEEGVWSDKYE